MKKILLTLAVLALTISAQLAMAAAGPTGLLVSKHNLSMSYTNGTKSTTSDQVCVYCHTPHNALAPSAAASSTRLWNHTLSSATYVNLKSGETQAAIAPNAYNKYTALCMSCHDGTVAISDLHNVNSFGGTALGFTGDVDGSNMLTGQFAIGTDMSTTHPIEVEVKNTDHYGSTTPKPNWYDAGATATSAKIFALGVVATSTTTGDYVTAYREGTTDTKFYVECRSCHDVHNSKGYANLTAMDNSVQSQMCQACHNK